MQISRTRFHHDWRAFHQNCRYSGRQDARQGYCQGTEGVVSLPDRRTFRRVVNDKLGKYTPMIALMRKHVNFWWSALRTENRWLHHLDICVFKRRTGFEVKERTLVYAFGRRCWTRHNWNLRVQIGDVCSFVFHQNDQNFVAQRNLSREVTTKPHCDWRKSHSMKKSWNLTQCYSNTR